MRIARLLLTTLLLIGLALPAFAAGDAYSTRTVTQIRYGPLGLVKVEVPVAPTPGAPLDEWLSPGRSTGLVALSGLFGVHVVQGSSHILAQVGLLKIPFMQGHDIPGRYLSAEPGQPAPTFENNPFDLQGGQPFYFDQPLFGLLDKVAILGPINEFETGQEPRIAAERTRVVDSLVFCLYQADEWEQDQYRKEWLDVPMVTTLGLERTTSGSATRVLETPLTVVFRHTEDGDGVETRLVDALAAKLFRRKATTQGEKKWGVVEAPLTSLVLSKKTAESKTLTVLGTANTESSLDSFRGGPLFCLWRSEKRSDGTGHSEFLHLPLLGPVFAVVDDGDHQWGAPFPRLIFWKKYRY